MYKHDLLGTTDLKSFDILAIRMFLQNDNFNHKDKILLNFPSFNEKGIILNYWFYKVNRNSLHKYLIRLLDIKDIIWDAGSCSLIKKMSLHIQDLLVSWWQFRKDILEKIYLVFSANKKKLRISLFNCGVSSDPGNLESQGKIRGKTDKIKSKKFTLFSGDHYCFLRSKSAFCYDVNSLRSRMHLKCICSTSCGL